MTVLLNTTVLLDTTVLIDALRRRGERREELAGMLADGMTLATSLVNVAELYAGMRSGEEVRTEEFLFGLEMIPVTASLGRRAGLLKAEKTRGGQTFSLADTLIASTALEYGMVLMTENRKNFVHPGLRLWPMKRVQ